MTSRQTEQGKTGKSKLSKRLWLVHGLEALRLFGLKGLNVEPLSEYMGVTKGSFYWHFKDREDFIESLLKYWEDELTTAVIDEIKALQVGPDSRLKALMEIVFKEDAGRYESDVRAWAAFDEISARSIARVDKQRLKYVKSLFEEIGFSKKEAEIRSRLWYLYLVGEFMIFSDRKERIKYLAEKHKIFTLK